jgi:hypothetical protein
MNSLDNFVDVLKHVFQVIKWPGGMHDIDNT